MGKRKRTRAGAAATELILETFRFNGRLLAAGDRLIARVGLTSARWQVLGSIAMVAQPGPVPHVARTLGLSRQNVQRIVNELVTEGYVRLAENPHHKRAKLVLLTEKGRQAYAAASALQVPWANRLAAGVAPARLRAALEVLRTLRTRLERLGERA